MTQQLSDCCKAIIDFNPQLDRPECYTCIECGRVIGSPLNTQQTHLQTKVKAVVKNITTTHLQRAKEEARDKTALVCKYNLEREIVEVEPKKLAETLDEIVTSTYLQAFEDGKIAKDKEISEFLMKDGITYEELQSLKQTKDV